MLDIKINKVDLIGSKILTNMLVLVRVGRQVQWSPTHYGSISAEFQCTFTFALTSAQFSILIYHNAQISDSLLEQSSFSKMALMGAIEGQYLPSKVKHVKRAAYAKANPQYCKSPLIEYEVSMTVAALKGIREVAEREAKEAKEEKERRQRQEQERSLRENEERERMEKMEKQLLEQSRFYISKQVRKENNDDIDEENMIFQSDIRPNQPVWKLQQQKPHETFEQNKNVSQSKENTQEKKMTQIILIKQKSQITESQIKMQQQPPFKPLTRVSQSARIDTRPNHLLQLQTNRGYVTSKHTNRNDESDQVRQVDSPQLNAADDLSYIKRLVNRKKHFVKLHNRTNTRSRHYTTQSESYGDLVTQPKQNILTEPSQNDTYRSNQSNRKLDPNINLESTFSRTPRPSDEFSPNKSRRLGLMNLKTIEQVVEEQDDATDKHETTKYNIQQLPVQSGRSSPKKRKYSNIQKYLEMSSNSRETIDDKASNYQYLILNTIIFQNFDKASRANPTCLFIKHDNTQIVTECIAQKSILFTKQKIPIKNQSSEFVSISVYQIVKEKHILFGKSQIHLEELRQAQNSRTIKLNVTICNVKVGQLLINHQFSRSNKETIRKRQCSLQQETIVRKRSSDSSRRKSTFSGFKLKTPALPSIYHKS